MSNLERLEEIKPTLEIALALYVISRAAINFAKAYSTIKKANHKG